MVGSIFEIPFLRSLGQTNFKTLIGKGYFCEVSETASFSIFFPVIVFLLRQLLNKFGLYKDNILYFDSLQKRKVLQSFVPYKNLNTNVMGQS